MRDLKYIFAYTVPLSAFISFESVGLGTFASVIYAFVILPFLDLITGNSSRNLSKEEENSKKTNWIFDIMLYLNLPIVFGLLYLVLRKFKRKNTPLMNSLGSAFPLEFYWQPMPLMWRMNLDTELRTLNASCPNVSTCPACICIFISNTTLGIT